ncbi:MAG TPA: alpha-amylase family glycosyl hydrolase [Chloroflexia bacterium]|nr:alpha-amylase family glycosyl hydrolase [Chloroflexia bacterium]
MKTDRLHRVADLTMLTGLLLTLVLSLFMGPVPFAHAAAPNTVTLVGTVQTAGGCGGTWDPTCAATHMTLSMRDGVYRITITLPAGDYQYKVAINDSWNENYGKGAASGGDNIPLHLAAVTPVKFYYDPVTHWITDNVNSKIVTAAGDFQHLVGCPGDWDPTCLKPWLEDIDGDGIYTSETTAITKGPYNFKAVLNEDPNWTENYGLGGVPGGPNVPFTVPNDNAKVSFKWDSNTKVPSASAGHNYDNNVEYDGLGHDSRDSLYRTPFGAVNPGTPVTLRFRTFHKDVQKVTIRLYDTAVGAEDREPMTRVASAVDCYDPALASGGNTCDFWEYTYTPKALGTTYYRFIAQDGTATAYYADTTNRYDGKGVATPNEADNGFRLNTVSSDFKVIPWMQNGVMYQVFPDRFRNGDPKNDPKTTDPRYAYPAPANATPQQLQDAADAQIVDKQWSDLPEGYCQKYTFNNTTDKCTESPKGRDYFGGDLKGLKQKLGYLQSVGITIIYLNPIFESGSNHGYDTRDYLQISKYFGTNQEFKALVEAAQDRGIKIILDGVFNHLSSDSPFFDRYHHYSTVGACESTTSQYRSWFTFHDVTPGTGVCVDSQGRPNSANYDGWAGYDSIPVITKRDPKNNDQPYGPVAQYFYQNPKTSVAGFWLNKGIGGWRFDVMTDPTFPKTYWEQLRTITKGINPDETLIAEAWHWYDNLPLTEGDQADTAMGYRFRNAVFGLLGAVDDKGFPEETNPNLPPSTFANRMLSLREDYADATYYTFQNLLDSHDTKRVLWSMTPGKDNRDDKEFNAANVALGKQREAIAALVQFTVPGTPTIYYGDEVSVTGADDPDDRRTFPWTDLKKNTLGNDQGDDQGNDNQGMDKYYGAGGDHNTLDWYRKLAGIRSANQVLRQGKLSFLLTDDQNLTLAYAMRKGNDIAITVINRNESATQNINVPLAGYLRDGVSLTDALTGKKVTTAGGKLSISLAPLGAAIFTMRGQDITGPGAASGLTASANNGLTSQVNLTWKGNADSASYNVYRSVVKGGGYVKIGNATTTSFTDSTVNNGTTYYYVVRGMDALGNEGDNSNEANATPAYPIGWAVLQWPKTINQVITSNYTTVYGQIYVQGLTDKGGDPDAITAQVGFGAKGSDLAGWNWIAMSYNAGHTGDNNYEYMAGIRADAPGNYSYLVRFSDDGGRNWTYGDQNGIGTATPGSWTVTASSDTTAPSTPVASIDFNSSNLIVSWTASTDPDDAVAEYRIYRGTAAGKESATPVAIVSGSTTSFVDSNVVAGQTYFYTVKAYDTSLNASGNSNEVSHKVEPKVVQVTFRVKVPASTPASDSVYITGQSQGVNPDPLCGYCGGNASTVMKQVDSLNHIWEITLGIPDGTPIQYKYTRGTYDYVEEWGSIVGFTNRVATVSPKTPTDLTQLFDDTSDTNPDDNHKAVQNWRDPLVTSASTTASVLKFTFNWDVKPSGTDFSDTIKVMSGSTAVQGTITHNAGDQSLTFTPATSLASGSYTVTVNNVISLTGINDGVKMRSPYTLNFNIP